MIKWGVLTVFVTIAAGLFYVANYTGYFRSVTILESTSGGPFRLLYKDHLGPYHKIVPVIEEVETWAKSKGIDCSLSFGLYLDDPKDVEQVRLKSRGGCILAKGQPDPTELPEDFKLQTYPEEATDFVIAEFTGSPGIGPFKVYPAVLEHIQQKRLALQGWNVLEVYEIQGPTSMKTTYYFPLLGGLQGLPE